jgi:glycosyltransferase involved in cell wall biosynthesis
MVVSKVFPEWKYLRWLQDWASAEVRSRIRGYLRLVNSSPKCLVTLSHLGYIKPFHHKYIHIVDVPLAHPFLVSNVLHSAYSKLGLSKEYACHQLTPRGIHKEHLSIMSADIVTVPSSFVKMSLISAGIPEEKIRKIPYGCNLKCNDFQDVTPNVQGNLKILFVGSLCVRKGLHILLDAFSRLDVHAKELVLVGPKTWETKYILNMFPNENITFAGKVSHSKISSYFSAAHVFVLPSLAEGQAMVLGEALSFGLPIIATASTGIQDLILDYMNSCILVEEDNPDSLLNALKTVAHNPVKVASMRSESRKANENISGWSTYSSMWGALIRDLT